MTSQPPGRLIAIGLALMLIGWVLPLLMVVRVIESTYLLNFLSYGAQLVGLFLGVIGVATWSRLKRK
jgi:hypothetical protein